MVNFNPEGNGSGESTIYSLFTSLEHGDFDFQVSLQLVTTGNDQETFPSDV